MSTEDKLLDDDDIIDLTDLLEEGEPSKKAPSGKEKAAKNKTQLNEPDSFDLGKEISMEYDVSVEEIDNGGENLDINGSLSSSEEVALTEEKAREEILLEGKEVKELDFMEDAPPPEPPSAREEQASLDAETVVSFSESDMVRGPGSSSRAKAVPELEEKPPATAPQDLETVSFEEVAAPEPAEAPIVEKAAAPAPETAEAALAQAAALPAETLTFDEAAALAPKSAETAAAAKTGSGGMEIEFDRRTLPEGDGLSSVSGGDLSAEIRQQAPAIIEGIVKPILAELVKDMIAATREQLPGIVEKVIREEIEKLKKLDSQS
jgi:hypothetical protein